MGGDRVEGLLDQLRDQASDSRRLPGAGAAGDHLQPAARGQLVQVVRDRALLAPVAIQVEPGPEQAQRRLRSVGSPSSRTATNALALSAPIHPSTEGHGSRTGRPARRIDARGVANRRQVDEHVTAPRPAYGERSGERHDLALLADELGQPHRDMHVGRRQHARCR